MRGIIRYIGSKASCHRNLLSMFPSDMSAYEYREPMIGGGSVLMSLMHSDNRPDIVRIGDLNPVISDIWKYMLYDNVDKRIEEFSSILSNINGIECKIDKLAYINNIEDAVYKELVMNQIRQFGNYGRVLGDRLYKLNNIIEINVNKLDTLFSGVSYDIRNSDYRWALNMEVKHKDKAFVFLDPPYYNVYDKKGYYGDYHVGFNYEELRDRLRNTNHKFLMTLDNSEYIRELFKEFNCSNIEVLYVINRQKVTERVIKNY